MRKKSTRRIVVSPDHQKKQNDSGDRVVASYLQSASAALAQQNLSQAEMLCHAVLVLEPEHFQALHMLGMIAGMREKPHESLEFLDRALSEKTDIADAHFHRGIALLDLGRLEESQASFLRTLELSPQHIGALINSANLFQTMGDPSQALTYFRRAGSLDPNMAVLRYNEGLCHLQLGDYSLGWPLHESRWQVTQLRLPQRHFAQPQWKGHEALEGKSILLTAEQGLGDTLQMLRYVGELIARGAAVVIEVQPALHDLLKNYPGTQSVLAVGEQLPLTDYVCPVMSLPFAFSTSVESIPSVPLYLTSPPDRLPSWEKAFAQLFSPRVGLVWSGNVTHQNDKQRSIPLQAMADLHLSRGQLISLQKDVRQSDQAALASRSDIVDISEQLVSYADTACVVELLDLIITVDTSVAHLAGAMGKPVWILLPANSDWRWLMHRNDSPWYPTARLFRQPRLGDWASVLAEVQSALDAHF